MRKKKLRLLAVLLAACMLCSCSAPVYPRSTDEPQLQFYYCTGEGADTGIGALAARPVSVPDERPDAVLQQYLTAPAGEGFSLPDGLSSSCAFDSCEDGTLTLLLDETAPEGLPASLAAACLTLTMTQLDGVDRVRLVRARSGRQKSLIRQSSFYCTTHLPTSRNMSCGCIIPTKMACSPRAMLLSVPLTWSSFRCLRFRRLSAARFP